MDRNLTKEKVSLSRAGNITSNEENDHILGPKSTVHDIVYTTKEQSPAKRKQDKKRDEYLNSLNQSAKGSGHK